MVASSISLIQTIIGMPPPSGHKHPGINSSTGSKIDAGLTRIQNLELRNISWDIPRGIAIIDCTYGLRFLGTLKSLTLHTGVHQMRVGSSAI